MRRNFLAALAVAGLAPSVFGQAPASTGRPIKIIVGFPAGTAPDIFARLYAERMAKALDVPVIVDNRVGVAGNLASDAVAKSPGDGLTLLYTVSNAISLSPHLYTKLPFDPNKDLKPVAPSIQQGLILVASNSVAARNVRDVVELAKTKTMSYGSYGMGSYSHLIMEMLSLTAQVQMTHVPYRTGPMNDVVGGQIDLLIEPPAGAMGFIQTKKVKAIAFTGSARHPSLPDLPTISEFYPGVAADAWHGFWVPGTTSPEIVSRLNELISSITRSPEISKRITDLYCQPFTATPAEMSALVARDSATWGKVIRDKAIKLD